MWLTDWTVPARAQLRSLLDAAYDEERPALVRAARRIGELLAAEGDKAGESRATQFRILIDSPRAVYFWAGRDEYLDVATVTRVWLWRPRTPPGKR